MKRISFTKKNRSGNTLHIETEGCIVNIHIGLTDMKGRKTVNVSVLPDRGSGEEWHIEGDTSIILVKEGKL